MNWPPLLQSSLSEAYNQAVLAGIENVAICDRVMKTTWDAICQCSTVLGAAL